MSRHVTFMTIDDAEHYTPEQRAAIVAAYPAHEREAREKGIPVLGSGRIFPIEERLISMDATELPAHFLRLGAMDFGWDHPFAAVKGVWDRDEDIVYIVRTFRAREQTPLLHVGSLRQWGEWLPWAWPHDGYQHDKGSGEELAQQYRKHGLNMLSENAKYPDGSIGVEAGLMDMLDRMQTGRLKIFAHLSDWWEEFRLYHREDGKVIKERDDLMAATRYLIMSLRFGKLDPRAIEQTREKYQKASHQHDYDPMAAAWKRQG